MASIFWAILSFLLFALQFGLGVFDLLFPALGAFLISLLTLFVPGFADLWVLQILSWSMLTVSSFIFLRKRFKLVFKGEILKIENERGRYAGQVAQVIEAIAPNKSGRIKFHGTTWTAWSLDETIEVGEQVYILEQQDLGFQVTAHLLDSPLDPKPQEIQRTEAEAKSESESKIDPQTQAQHHFKTDSEAENVTQSSLPVVKKEDSLVKDAKSPKTKQKKAKPNP